MNFIAEIDGQADITIYLNKSQVEFLVKETLEGVLVKSEKPKKQGTINISVNDERKSENGFEIGINDNKYWGVLEGFHLDVFVGFDAYSDLIEKGRIGVRHRMRSGSKLAIYDLSRSRGVEKNRLEDLEFYVANKDILPSYMG